MRKEIPLTQGQVAIVDEEDYAKLACFNWHAVWSHHSKTFYAVRRLTVDGKKKAIYMHREIMQTPKGFDTDHKDNNGLHNWRDNLRVATRAQNTQASRSRGPKSTTGFRGVMKKTDPRYKHKQFWSKIVFEGKSIFLGNFITAEEASTVYEAKAKELFGEFYIPPEERSGREDREETNGNTGSNT